MTPEQFCYWLQGYCELNGDVPTKEQWESVLDHLKLVFNKVTPDRMPEKMEMPKPDMEVPQEAIDKLVEHSRKNNPATYPPVYYPALPYRPAPWDGPIC